MTQAGKATKSILPIQTLAISTQFRTQTQELIEHFRGVSMTPEDNDRLLASLDKSYAALRAAIYEASAYTRRGDHVGASSFIDTARRADHKTAKEAFDVLVGQSRHDRGHRYSGEIGMKNAFQKTADARKCKTLREAYDEAARLLREGDYDKWGPAEMIEVDGDQGGWVFFGWSPS